MILALDVGNTRIKAAVFDGECVRTKQALKTNAVQTVDDVIRLLRTLMSAVCASDIRSVGVASVVPRVTELLDAAVPQVGLPAALFIGPHLELGLCVAVRYPEHLGADRIADAVAAVARVGCPAITLNCGTAITMTVVDAQRRLVGGAIAAGPRLVTQALCQGTAQLPAVELHDHAAREVPSAVGTDTESAIRAGAIHGAIGTARQLTDATRTELGETIAVVVTGGFARLIAPHLVPPLLQVEDLTLDGIRRIVLANP